MGLAEDYEASWLTSFLHSFPHLNLKIQNVSSTFRINDSNYRESLLFWAALPVLWLLLTLLLFLVYFCYRCCQRDVEKKQQVPCLRWTMAILALLTCGVVGVGFYGNEDIRRGVQQAVVAANDADVTISSMKSQVYLVQFNINDTVKQGINGLYEVYNRQEHVQKRLGKETHIAYNHARKIVDDVGRIDHQAAKIKLTTLISHIKEYALYRWLGMLLLLAWMVMLCLILLLGVAKSSKCTLLLFCAFGIFTLVLCWMSAGFHLGVSVGLSDFCVAPGDFFAKLSKDSRTISAVEYYVKCMPNRAKNPFEDSLHSAIDNIRRSEAQMDTTMSRARNSIKREPDVTQLDKYEARTRLGLSAAKTSVMRLMALTECTNLHKDYMDGIHGICSKTLPGVAFLLLASVITGLLFTFLVLLASKAWRHFSKSTTYAEHQESSPEKYPGEYVYNAEEAVPLQNVDDGSVTHYRKGYLEIDDEDTFLPRPDNTSPSYIRYGSLPSRPTSIHEDPTAFTRGRPGNPPREHMSTMPRRSTPPPAAPVHRTPPVQFSSQQADSEVDWSNYTLPTLAYNSYKPGAGEYYGQYSDQAVDGNSIDFNRESHA